MLNTCDRCVAMMVIPIPPPCNIYNKLLLVADFFLSPNFS